MNSTCSPWKTCSGWRKGCWCPHSRMFWKLLSLTWPTVSCVKERASFVNFAGVQPSSSHFKPQHVEDVQLAELAFTSSVSGPPNAPGVQGSQLGGDFWKVCPLQQHDAPECCEKGYSTGLMITPIRVYYWQHCFSYQVLYVKKNGQYSLIYLIFLKYADSLLLSIVVLLVILFINVQYFCCYCFFKVFFDTCIWIVVFN